MAKRLKKSAASSTSNGKAQTFSIKVSEATSVLLVGDFTDWEKNPIALRKEADGIWRATVSLPAGEHRYRFLIDGQWCDDPECALRVPNPYGSHDAVVRVSL